MGNDLNIYQVIHTPKGLDWKLVPEISSLKSKVLFSDSNILDFSKFYSSSSTKEKEILLGVRDILVEELQHDYPEEYQNLFDFLYIVRQFIFSQGFLKNRIDKHEESDNWKKIKDKYGNYYNQHWKPFDIIKDLVLRYHSCSHLWDKKYNSKPLQKLNSLKKSLKRPTNMKDVRDIEKFNSITLKSLIETIEEYQDKQKTKKPTEMCQFLKGNFTQDQLIDIIIEIQRRDQKYLKDTIEEFEHKLEFQDMSIQQLCSTIEEIFPELNNQGMFSFCKNFIKNIKKEHVCKGVALVLFIGGLYTLYKSGQEMRKQLKDTEIYGKLKDTHHKLLPEEIKTMSLDTAPSIYKKISYATGKKPNSEDVSHFIISFILNPFSSFKRKIEKEKIIKTIYKYPLILFKNAPIIGSLDINWTPLRTAAIYLSGAMLGVLPSIPKTFLQTKNKRSIKKKIEDLRDFNKQNFKSIKKIYHKLNSIKKKKY